MRGRPFTVPYRLHPALTGTGAASHLGFICTDGAGVALNRVTQGSRSYGEIGDCEQSTSYMRGTRVEHCGWGPDRETRTLDVSVYAAEQGVGGSVALPPPPQTSKQKLGGQSSPRFGAEKLC